MKPIPDSGRGISGRQAEYRHVECPLRGAKTLLGFHPFANLSPILAEKSAAGRQNTVMRNAPAGAKTQPGFHPIGNHFQCENCHDVNPIPILAENQRWAGRIPSCGGCASPSGAQCRRMAVFCLPSRCRIGEG
ncbi:MAG: hypothetical protein LBK61_05135 [Spirochaetaceae bacterium]|nr:hypothetical protein [Spirochaetaceae bacterium]